MPLLLPDKLPAIERLKAEHIYVGDDKQKFDANVPTLRIALLNLMPIKENTETDFVRVLSYSQAQIDLRFMKLRSHTPQHTSAEHMEAFYEYFDELRKEHIDGFIVTGAPIEHLEFEDVNYWTELSEIFAWADANVRSTLYICWAAQAGLYYHYGVPKHRLPTKKFGIFSQWVMAPELPLFRGFDDRFNMPHSRHTEVRAEEIRQHSELNIVAESPQSGVSIVTAHEGRQIFVTGHMEYEPYTLDNEYRRDKGKRDDVELPENYYVDNNPQNKPNVTWRAHANLLFNNWINYYLK